MSSVLRLPDDRVEARQGLGRREPFVIRPMFLDERERIVDLARVACEQHPPLGGLVVGELFAVRDPVADHAGSLVLPPGVDGARVRLADVCCERTNVIRDVVVIPVVVADGVYVARMI